MKLDIIAQYAALSWNMKNEVYIMGWNIFGAYVVVSFVVFGFAMMLLQASDYKGDDWKVIFIFQGALYESIKDKLNIYGIIILEVLITLLTFGTSAFMFIAGVVAWLCMLIWKLFCFIFKRGKYEK